MKITSASRRQASFRRRSLTRAIAIVSGGLDSVVMAHLLKRQGHELHILSFNYGQRHQRELECANAAAMRLDASWDLIDLSKSGLARLLKGSALTDDSVEVPEGHYAAESMKATVVPNRNSIMLAIAVGVAVAEDAGVVAIAVHAGDHPIYPDCRPGFISAFEVAERYANERPNLHIYSPFIHKLKMEIVATGASLGVPFQQTWSCYKGGDVHCGACGTCYERREAFKIAGVVDPTTYAATPEFEAPVR